MADTDFEPAELRRKWALEQAIKLHGPNGSTLEFIFQEAAKLVKWVTESERT